MVLNEHNSSCITSQLEPGIYTFKDLTESLFNILQPEYELINNPVDIEFDDITMRTKLVVTPGIVAIRFDEKSFFDTILGFTPHWMYNFLNEYISQKIANLSTKNKILLKRDCIYGSILDGCRQPIWYSFVLVKPAGFKVFSKPETNLYKTNE